MSSYARASADMLKKLAENPPDLWRVFPHMQGLLYEVTLTERYDGPELHLTWYGVNYNLFVSPYMPTSWLKRDLAMWDSTVMKSLPLAVRLTTTLEDFHNYSLEDKRQLLDINPHLLPLTFTDKTYVGRFMHRRGERLPKRPFYNRE